MLINIPNALTQQAGIQQTYLAGTIAAGGTIAPVKNIGGFNNQWAVQIGQSGEETAEIMVVSAIPSGTTLTFGTASGNITGTFKYAHALDTSLYQIHYDQIVLNRSTTGTIGPFSPVGTYSIQPNNPYTQIDDTTGLNSYAYYAQYYNSVSGDLSGTSSIFTPGGPTFYSLQKIRQRVKDKLYSAGYIRDDSVIDDWINECYEDMVNAAIKVNQGYMLGTNIYGFGTAGCGTITDSAFVRPVKMEVTWDAGVTWTPSSEVAINNFSENDIFSTSNPNHVWTGETTFEILPHTTAGSARVTYAVRFTPLVNDSDELTQTVKPYTGAFVEYALATAYGLDQKDTDFQLHDQKFQQAKGNFIVQVTPRDLTGPKTINLVESISGMDDDDMFW